MVGETNGSINQLRMPLAGVTPLHDEILLLRLTF